VVQEHRLLDERPVRRLRFDVFVTVDGVLLHDIEFVRGQLERLIEDLLGDDEFTEVVQERADPDDLDAFRVVGKPFREKHRDQADVDRMGVGVIVEVLQFDEVQDRAVGIGQALHESVDYFVDAAAGYRLMVTAPSSLGNVYRVCIAPRRSSLGNDAC
jgi:hypothetical protein